MLQNIENNKLQIGAHAPDFVLPGVDGLTYALGSFAEADALVLFFTCNHCPYAQAYEDRIIALQQEFIARKVLFVAINSNDEKAYPEDSFENMVIRSADIGYNFPYLRDREQTVADAYGAQCTPEFFLFDKNRILRYHGRLDDNWKEPSAVTRQDLRLALEAVLNGSPLERPEEPAIGCSLKWLL